MKVCKDCKHVSVEEIGEEDSSSWRCQRYPRINYQTGKPLKDGWCDVKNDNGECKDHELNV